MTQEQIQRQVAAIHQATAEAMRTPEAARQFLIDAGIMLEEKPKKQRRRSQTKKKT